MKKSILIISCLLAAVIATSCNSSDAKETTAAEKAAAASTVRGADGVERPVWVLAGREDDKGIYAVGAGKMSNYQNSLKLARANARTELSRTLMASTKSVLRSYTEDTGNAKDAINYMEEAIQVKSANILAGTKQVDMWQAEDGTVFVLMIAPYDAVLPEVVKIADEFAEDAKTVLSREKAQAAFEKYFDEH